MSIVETSLSATKLRNQQEFLLQGSILDNNVEDLLHRLRGLCDNADSPAEVFHDLEMVYSLRVQTTGQTIQLRVRKAEERQLRVRKADEPPDDPTIPSNQYPWHLRYLGAAELGDKNRSTLVRSCVDVAVSPNVTQFLTEMGFKLDFEYFAKGFMFKKGRMKVIVAKIRRVPPNDHLHDANPSANANAASAESVSNSYLVELSVVAPAGQDGLAEEVKAFAEQLKPLVHLDKVDHRRIL